MHRLPNYNPAEHSLRPEDLTMTRREFLQRTGMSMGAMSLAMMMGSSMISSSAHAATNNVTPPHPLNFPNAKAKHVIHIFASGGPSQVDTWDPKPALTKYADKTLPGLNGLGFA